MKIQEIQFLYSYNYWARDRLLDQAARLSTSQFIEHQSYGHGSIRNDLVHILSAEWIWRVRCQEKISPKSLLQFEDFPSVEHLQARWRQEEDQMFEFLRTLSEREIEGVVTYRRTGGESRANVLWHVLLHIINHGTEHRSQVAAELTAFGYSPGDLDFIHFLRAVNS